MNYLEKLVLPSILLGIFLAKFFNTNLLIIVGEQNLGRCLF